MARREALKNLRLEFQLFRERAIVSAGIVAMTFLVLLTRLYDLQITNHAHYQTRSQENHVRVLPVAPTRGLIFDRNGVLLADNKPNYQLVITPSQVKNMSKLLTELQEFVEIEEHELERFFKTIKRKQSFQKTPLKFNLTDQQVARFAVNQYRFAGVEIGANSTRFYPLKNELVHALGYVGRINEKEMTVIDKQNYDDTTHIGKLGIEKYYEDLLHGKVGYKHVEINAQGRTLREFEGKAQPPSPGVDIQLSLVAELQTVAQQALGEENGAVVALDPNNGEILAFVSQPTYDPNAFVNGIGSQAYGELRDSENRPLFNRALIGQYPPGSTIKPLIALAGLHYEVTWASKTMVAGPHFRLPGKARRYRDWKKSGHGLVNMNSAIAQSCDVYFYDLGYRLGIDRIHEFLSQFGLGKSTQLDTVGEATGILPSAEWKRRARGEAWFPGETVITGIGQGYMLTTPLQLAAMTAIIANRGKSFQPRFVHATRVPGELSFSLIDPKPLPAVQIRNQSDWDEIHDAMINVVHAPNGTARRIGRGAEYQIAGKTGTAQVFGIGQDEEYDAEKVAKKLRDHALFIAFAPADDPKIAIAVVVENGGSGSSAAAPVARRVLDAYLLKEDLVASH